MTSKNHFRILFLGLCFSLLLFNQPVQAQGFKDQFIDTLDHKEDLTRPSPPSISMAGGLYTESKSWGAMQISE